MMSLLVVQRKGLKQLELKKIFDLLERLWALRIGCLLTTCSRLFFVDSLLFQDAVVATSEINICSQRRPAKKWVSLHSILVLNDGYLLV